jgi:mono/diheme cytochrome c family protein
MKWDINTVNVTKMKRVKFGFLGLTLAILSIGCLDKHHPGLIYMPDMAYSRAYETYAPNNLKNENINYIPYPVPGTIKRGDLFPYTLANDTTGYRMSADVKDPLPPLDSVGMNEAQRLFNINCAICHGANLDAQGPMATSGKVGGIANLQLDQFKKMPEGTMFHVATYGKNNMGSYASQLDKKQRWMVVQYIKFRQAQSGGAKTDSTAVSGTAGADTTAKK